MEKFTPLARNFTLPPGLTGWTNSTSAPPFFLVILYQIITSSMFFDVFSPLPPFFYCFCLEFKIIFLPQISWGLPLLFTVIVCIDVVDVLRHNLTTSLPFYHPLSNYHKVNVLLHILAVPPFFNIFCWDFKIKFSPTYFGAFPYFLQLLSVLTWLMFSDIIRLSPFFFMILYPIITRSMFSDIFWPFTLFFNIFCQDFKIKFSPTYFGAFPYFLQFLSVLTWLMFSDIIWPSPFFFYHSLSNYHKLNVLLHILALPPFFHYFLLRLQNQIFSDIFWGLPLLFTVFVCSPK